MVVFPIDIKRSLYELKLKTLNKRRVGFRGNTVFSYLGTDLVTALAGLDVHNFPHCGGESFLR